MSRPIRWYIDGSSTGPTRGCSVLNDYNGNLFIVGAFSDAVKVQYATVTTSSKDLFVFKLNQSGILEWLVQLDVDHDRESPVIANMDSNDDVHIMFLNTSQELVLAHVCNYGECKQIKVLIKDGFPLRDYRMTCDTNVYFCCTFNKEVNTDRMVRGESIVCKLDYDYEFLWTKNLESKASCIDIFEESVIISGLDDEQAFVMTTSLKGYNDEMYYFPKVLNIVKVHDMVIDVNQDVYLVAEKMLTKPEQISSDPEVEQESLSAVEVVKVCKDGSAEIVKSFAVPTGRMNLQGYLWCNEFYLYLSIDNHNTVVFRNFKMFTEIDEDFNMFHPALSFEENTMFQGGSFLTSSSVDVSEFKDVIKLRGPQHHAYFVVGVNL